MVPEAGILLTISPMNKNTDRFEWSLTCHASGERSERGNDELVGEEEDVAPGIPQVGEAHRHGVSTRAGGAESAHLSGCWNSQRVV